MPITLAPLSPLFGIHSIALLADAVSASEVATGVLSAIGGAAITGVTLYLRLRRGIADVKKSEVEVEKAAQINVEAEWKRLLDLQSLEIARLTTRVGGQDAEIRKLQDEHIKCLLDGAEMKGKLGAVEAQVAVLIAAGQKPPVGSA